LRGVLTKFFCDPKGINIMYSLGLLIVDLETARRRLLDVFEEPDKGSGRTVAEPLPRSAHRQPKDVDGDRQTFHLRPNCFAGPAGTR